eukprot:753040-Hanusia_phi.AAC.3
MVLLHVKKTEELQVGSEREGEKRQRGDAMVLSCICIALCVCHALSPPAVLKALCLNADVFGGKFGWGTSKDLARFPVYFHTRCEDVTNFFLYETAVSSSVDDIIKELVEIWNMQIQVLDATSVLHLLTTIADPEID